MAVVDDILRATLKFNMGGNSIGNLVHQFRVVVGTELDYVLIATAINTALTTGYAAIEAHMHTEISPISLDLSEWDFTDNEWDGKSSVAATVPDGTIATEPLPSGVAYLMRWPTDELRRQARKFIPGPTELSVAGNALTGSAVTALGVSAALLNNDITAGALTLRPCTFNDTPLSPRFETHSDFSTTSIVNTNVAYQRRRQPGVGI